jgi:hypothetical protein
MDAADVSAGKSCSPTWHKKMGSGKHQKSSKLETFKVLQIAFECSKRLTG